VLVDLDSLDGAV
jgi:hnRNP-L/PTB/hephaestus splicing factor